MSSLFLGGRRRKEEKRKEGRRWGSRGVVERAGQAQGLVVDGKNRT